MSTPGPDTKTSQTARIVVIFALAQALLVALFVLPAHKPEPHDLPLAVAGGPQAAAAVERQVERMRPGAFDIVPVADLAEGRQAILDREVYGALDPRARRLLASSAASPAISQLLRAAFEEAAPNYEDVRPLDPQDPRGATLNLLMLPLIVLALPLAALLIRMPLSRGAALAATLAFAVLGSLLVMAVVNGLIGALPGNYLALSAVGALLIAAVALPAVGLARLIGPAGIGIVAVVVVLIGNPGSGNANGPELLPGFWRVVGPLLPPGAGGSALRNVAYFDGAALAQPLIVLAVFALAGAALLLAARRRAE